MMTATIAKVLSFNVTTPIKTLHHPSLGWFCRKNCRFHFQSPHYTGCCFQAACIFWACGPSDYFDNVVTVSAEWYWDAISVAHHLSFCWGLSSSQPEVWAGWEQDPMPRFFWCVASADWVTAECESVIVQSCLLNPELGLKGQLFKLNDGDLIVTNQAKTACSLISFWEWKCSELELSIIFLC